MSAVTMALLLVCLVLALGWAGERAAHEQTRRNTAHRPRVTGWPADAPYFVGCLECRLLAPCWTDEDADVWERGHVHGAEQ